MFGNDNDVLNTAILRHTILTIDGNGTFHGMGMIAALTPGQKTDQGIPRLNTFEETPHSQNFQDLQNVT